MIQSIQVATVALTVAQEAGGEIQDGKLAVAYVIKNRSTAYGVSCSDVCLKAYQFSCWNTDSPTRMNLDVLNESVWAQSVVAALQAMYRIEPDPTNGALYYLNPNALSELPDWWDSDTDPSSEVVIGNHVFRGPATVQKV